MSKEQQSRVLAEQIRVRRKELGLTQADLAELAGVSTRFVHELERAKQTVQLAKLIDVARALGLELELKRRQIDGS